MADLPEREWKPEDGHPLPPIPDGAYGPEAEALSRIIESGQVVGLDVEANGGVVIDESDRA